MNFLILFLLLSLSAFGKPQDFIKSTGFSFVTLTSESQLQDLNQHEVLTFRPNVTTGFGINLETQYISLGYTFSGKDPQSDDFDRTKFRDLRFNFHFNHFDFRLMTQWYKGAVVRNGGKSHFYQDYEVRSFNGRIHYYFKDDFLNYIREGEKLIHMVSAHHGLGFSGSWFLGLNLDRRSIQLPKVLEPEHQAEVDRRDIQYHTQFNALTTGPLIGFDSLLQWETTYLRGKVGGGPGFQNNGGTVGQFEIALNSGWVLYQRHLLSLGIDIYILSFKDQNQRISNNNNQVNLSYTYAF